MSNSDEKIQPGNPGKASTAPKGTVAQDVPRGMPVKLLRFVSSIQVPGHSVTNVVSAIKQPNGAYWEVDYIPQMRHHRITYCDPNRKKLDTVFVPESQVQSWEPAAL